MGEDCGEGYGGKRERYVSAVLLRLAYVTMYPIGGPYSFVESKSSPPPASRHCLRYERRVPRHPQRPSPIMALVGCYTAQPPPRDGTGRICSRITVTERDRQLTPPQAAQAGTGCFCFRNHLRSAIFASNLNGRWNPPNQKFHRCRSLQRPPRHRQPIAAPPSIPPIAKNRRRTCPTSTPNPAAGRLQEKNTVRLFHHSPSPSMGRTYLHVGHAGEAPEGGGGRHGGWSFSFRWNGSERPETVGRVIANNIGELKD